MERGGGGVQNTMTTPWEYTFSKIQLTIYESTYKHSIVSLISLQWLNENISNQP